MAETYSAVVTNLGTSLIEDAYNNSSIVNITQMAIGDSNGAYVEPNPAFTSLVNELGREDIHESSTVGHLIHVYVYVTSKFAGETIREFGLYDDANNLVVYAAYPESLVPDAASGEYIQLEIECIVDFENAEVVNIVVNPIYPHATELEAGIAKIVSEADVDNDEEDSKFLTIKKLLKRAATTVKAGVARFSTSAEAINGTDVTTMLNPSVGLALLKSRISSALDGTRTDYSASESALGLVNTKAESAVKRAGDTMLGVLGITGLKSAETGTNVFIPDAESGNGVYAGTKEQWFRIFAKNGLAQIFDGDNIFNIYHEGNPPSASDVGAISEDSEENFVKHDDLKTQTPNQAAQLGTTDLNDLVALQHAGFYYQNSDANIPGNNYPSSTSGSLLVQMGAAGTTQLYIEHYTGQMYTRAYFSDWTEWRTVYDSLNPPPNTAPVRVIILSPEVITSMGSYTFPDGITWYDIVELGVTWTATTGTTIQTNVYDTHVWNGVSLNSSTTDFAGYLPVASTGLNFGTVAKASGNGFTLSTTSASGKVQGMYAYITAEAAARLATRNMHIDKAGNIFDAKKIVQLAKNITTAKEHVELEAKEIRDWNDSIFMEIVHQRSLLDAIQEEPESASKSRMIIKHEEEISLLESKYKAEPESNSLTK